MAKGASPSSTLLVFRPPPDALRGGCFRMLRMYMEASAIAFGFHVILFLALLGVYLSLFDSSRPVGLTILAIYIGGVIVPVGKYHPGSTLRTGRMMEDIAAFFDMECVCEEPLSGHPERQYLLAQYPHGIWPMAPLLSAYFIDRVLPDQPLYCGVATALFRVPYFTYFFQLVGGVPASKATIREVKRMGASISIVVGGVHEMFLVGNDGYETIILRTGFIREAIKNGFHIVPVFHFGNSRVFYHIRIPIVDTVFELISRRLYAPVILYCGPYGLPIPYKTKIKMVIGRPIAVQQQDEPTPEEVKRLYDLFKSELTRIYREHRPEWESRQLRFYEKER